MRNASERKAIRRAEKLAADLEAKRINFVVAAMSTEAGRSYFHNLLSGCQIFAANFANDPFSSGRIEGARNIGLMIYSDIVTNCPDSFVQMMREATIQEQLNDRRSNSPVDRADVDEYPGSSDADWGDSGSDTAAE